MRAKCKPSRCTRAGMYSPGFTHHASARRAHTEVCWSVSGVVRNRVRHCRPARLFDRVPFLEGCAGRSEGEDDSSASYKYFKLELIYLFIFNYVKLNLLLFTWQARFAI